MSLELSGYVTNSGREIDRATRLATQDGFATSLEGTFYLGEPALASSTNRSEVFGAEAASRCRPERRTETPAQHRCTEYACRAVVSPAADSRLEVLNDHELVAMDPRRDDHQQECGQWGTEPVPDVGRVPRPNCWTLLLTHSGYTIIAVALGLPSWRGVQRVQSRPPAPRATAIRVLASSAAGANSAGPTRNRLGRTRRCRPSPTP